MTPEESPTPEHPRIVSVPMLPLSYIEAGEKLTKTQQEQRPPHVETGTWIWQKMYHLIRGHGR